MNLGRQLKRVRQQADHILFRSEKTDVVGKLKYPEDRVEALRVLTEQCVRSIEKGLYLSEDKKQKRNPPETNFSESLKQALGDVVNLEHMELDGQHTLLLGRVMDNIIQAQKLLGENVTSYEKDIQEKMLDELQKLLRDDFPAVLKQKKVLAKYGLDVDAAKQKQHSASVNPKEMAKSDTFKEELEEAESKLEQARDVYAHDIYALLARDKEISKLIFLFLQFQRNMHQQAVLLLDGFLPEIQKDLLSSPKMKVFGTSLEQHLKVTINDIAVPIKICACRLLEIGLDEEGLLRVAGSAHKVKKLKACFDANLVTLESLEEDVDEFDAHVVAGALKSYLRELPEPLLTRGLYDRWLKAVRIQDHDKRLKELWLVLNDLPPANKANLRYFIKFAAKIVESESLNKMSAANVATVVAPNLIWAHQEEDVDLTTLGRNMSLTSDYRSIVDQLVNYHKYFFNEDVDFGVQPKVTPPSSSRPRSQIENGAHHHNGMTHRRTASTDNKLGASIMSDSADSIRSASSAVPTPGDCESPKQINRGRKKPAPQPPQQTAPSAPLGNSMQRSSGSRSSGSSPEQSRSHTPPKETAPLRHSASMKRPTVDPPKPPTISSSVTPPSTLTSMTGSFRVKPEKPAKGPAVQANKSVSGEMSPESSVLKPLVASTAGSFVTPALSSGAAKPPLATGAAQSALSSQSAAEASSKSMTTATGSSSLVRSGSVQKAGQPSTVAGSQPVKPPRPAPPNLEQSQLQKSPPSSKERNVPGPIGFEELHTARSRESLEFIDDNAEEIELRKHNKDAPIGFNVESPQGDETNAVVPPSPKSHVRTAGVRQSIEISLRNQMSGAPVSLLRHTAPATERHSQQDDDSCSTLETTDSVSSPTLMPQKLPGMEDVALSRPLSAPSDVSKMPPVPATRTAVPTPIARSTVKENLQQSSTTADKPEPAPRPDKPAVPEKPHLSRSTGSADLTRPLVAERPPLLYKAASTPNCDAIANNNGEIGGVEKRASQEDLVETSEGSSSSATTPPPVIATSEKAQEKPDKPPKPAKPAVAQRPASIVTEASESPTLASDGTF